ncbi:MAG TPA: hypothetical protein V6C71_17655 [Coleofasciculaceae cyanobacterium]|jgi:hypothetical protein
MTKKHLYALLICFSLIAIIVPQVLSSPADTCTYNPEAYQGLSMARLSQELTNTGLLGRIHGAAEESQMYVMAVREPTDFFSHREFSLITKERETKETLNRLNRHDLVCIQGEFIANPSPQKHIALNSIQVIEPWAQPKGFAPYERQTNIAAELKKQTSIVATVHAIGEAGKILVIEYQDAVIPIFVSATEYTQGLYRGDIIKLTYQIQQYPQRPLHLQLDTTVGQPIEVIDAIAAWNGQPKTLSGNLVKFPQSPQLKFDVYAMEVDTKGIKRYFTLINFENMAEFDNIRQKLANIWDKNAATAISGRNMLINPEVTIEATGLGSIVSPEQANPQILLESAEQVQQVS